MCDVKKYSDIYKEIAKLSQADTLQLVLEAPDEDTKEFYDLIGDFLMQKKQKEMIEANRF